MVGSPPTGLFNRVNIVFGFNWLAKPFEIFLGLL